MRNNILTLLLIVLNELKNNIIIYQLVQKLGYGENDLIFQFSIIKFLRCGLSFSLYRLYKYVLVIINIEIHLFVVHQ